jgi:hypothetical protein
VFHGALTAAGPHNPALAETLFSAFKANAGISGWYTGHIPASVSFTGVTVKDLRAGNNPTLASSGVSLVGSAAGTVTPGQSALVVTHRSALSGRAFRGRTYLSGLIQADMLDAHTWTGGAGAAGVAFMQGVQSVMTANSIPMVIAQQPLGAGTTAGGAPLPARPAGTVPITSFDIANPRIDSQRRRLGR